MIPHVLFIVGVDPGANGCIVLFGLGRAPRTFENAKGQLEQFYRQEIGGTNPNRFLVGFEKVSSRPDDDPYTAFQFGKNTGKVLGVLEYLGLSIEEIPPQTWQREFGLGAKYKDQPTRKRAHKKKAQELFPAIKVTLDTCDAILIAEYMWRKTFGELKRGKDENYQSRSGTGVTRSTSSLSDI